MNRSKALAGAAAAALTYLTLTGVAPAHADGPSAALHDNAPAGVDVGRARNDIGNGLPAAPVRTPASTDSGADTGDLMIGAAAGLLVAGGGVGAAIAFRRRHQPAHHTA